MLCSYVTCASADLDQHLVCQSALPLAGGRFHRSSSHVHVALQFNHACASSPPPPPSRPSPAHPVVIVYLSRSHLQNSAVHATMPQAANQRTHAGAPCKADQKLLERGPLLATQHARHCGRAGGSARAASAACPTGQGPTGARLLHHVIG
eukprot:358582-Chlamydomonas_euryale.AAC.6